MPGPPTPCSTWTALLAAGAVLTVGCTEQTDALVDHGAWVALAAGEDPFDDRPASIDCVAEAWGYEDFGGEDSVEVDTTRCDYVSLSQPSLVELRSGDSIRVRLWHETLEGPVGEAHLALAVDGALVWETRLAIPGESGLDSPTLEVDAAADAGAEIVFHAHNHGANSYSLIELSRTGLR